MALRKLFSGRYLHTAKHSYAQARNRGPDLRRLLPSVAAGAATRRMLLQQRTIFLSGVGEKASVLPLSSLPLSPGDNLIARIRSSMMRDQFRHDIVPSPKRSETALKEEDDGISRLTISAADARKLFKASRIEAARARLRTIPRSYISGAEFAEICREAAPDSKESAGEISAALDRSGSVVVLPDIVLLRPEQVARAIETTINLNPINDQQRRELNYMEARKAEIDHKAEVQVKRELWAGLGLGLLQTAGFFRLTFWELSWDVMEPICFFTTSIYFMLGYYFFLRTSKEPSFQGFFASRFASKQRRLMKLHGFDLLKFNKLRKSLRNDSHECEGFSNHLTSCDCHCQRHRVGYAFFGGAH